MIQLASKRSAEAGIMGFTYQFIQTVIKILETKNEDTSFTIEGIEDLDVSTVKEEELVQYKYHEAKKYTLSAIQKPIALMFKHFIENYSKEKKWKTKYTLFCFFGIDEKRKQISPNLITTTIELNTILNYTEAQSILKDNTWSEELEEKFLKYLIFSKADKFDDAYKKLIDVIKNVFQVNEIESKVGYFSNAIFYINKLAIQKNPDSRKITKREFIDYLTKNYLKNEAAIIQRLYGKDKYIATLKKYLSFKNVKPYTTSHVFYLPTINSKTSRFIIDLAKKFFVSGERKDVKPITLIINSDEEQLKKLKRELSQITILENLDLVFNDGYEEFYFNHKYFNKAPLITLQGNRQKIENASYNYKLISFKTFNSHQKNILFDYPLHIFIDDVEDYALLDNYSNMNKFIINNLNEQEILQLFGG
ncbi:hypothetical protein QN089_14550 [Kurthia sp. YJT4]|uniref:hypothetical protein n=1 Tax=Kurthia sp. YJT4 TaxID=3049086 RepID=UPI00254F2A23|nr:hypothetical protein [Kurthia sp. YJT4]WIL38500.1 hypothetical protein QN089_14550 [Kurthia sp. YJT4]